MILTKLISRAHLLMHTLTLLPLVCSITSCGVGTTAGKGVVDSPTASPWLQAEQNVSRQAVSSLWHSGVQGFAAARQEQQAARAPLAVYFYTDWCFYCKQFDEEFLTSSEVQSALTQVVKVRINPEDGTEEEAIAKQFGVRGYPAVFIVRPSAAPRQVYPFKPVGETWVVTSPSKFAQDCHAAAFER